MNPNESDLYEYRAYLGQRVRSAISNRAGTVVAVYDDLMCFFPVVVRWDGINTEGRFTSDGRVGPMSDVCVLESIKD